MPAENAVKQEELTDAQKAKQARIEAHKQRWLKYFYELHYQKKPVKQEETTSSAAGTTSDGTQDQAADSQASAPANDTPSPLFEPVQFPSPTITDPPAATPAEASPPSPANNPAPDSPESTNASPPSQTLSVNVTKKRPRDENVAETVQEPTAIPKKSKTTEPAKASPKLPAIPPPGPRTPPEWYVKINTDRIKLKNRGPLVRLNRFTDLIKEAKGEPRGSTTQLAVFAKIRSEIHELEFMQVSGDLLRKANMLDNSRGLSQLFDSDFRGSMRVPWDIESDALELYNKWSQRMFNPDLLRGINTQPRLVDKSIEKKGWSINPKYGSLNARFFGNGFLVNGQWWPRQICAVRDGAHAHLIAGITGIKNEGAVSVVMSGSEYDNHDRDEGNEVWYSGTTSNEGITEATNFMILSLENRKPVRLMRSSNIPNSKYKPSHGFRYDGLYDVVGRELVNVSKHHYLFHLVRQPNQAPIRYSGFEARPTTQEIEKLQEVERLLGMRGGSD